jgi:hypothetical protein
MAVLEVEICWEKSSVRSRVLLEVEQCVELRWCKKVEWCVEI